MSHLSKIKTIITDTNILKKTLNTLDITWIECSNKLNNSKKTIVLNSYKEKQYPLKAELNWDGKYYELFADSNTWQEKQQLNALIEKIHQKYAYNIIIEESARQGFNNTNTNILQDGSLRIVLERWQP